jgi:class 3 adenylate cyclase
LVPRPRAAPGEYTPPHLRDAILRSRSALEGERKQVTVLFADVKGSTELAESIDPEEWHGLLDRLFQILSQGVHRHEGTVNQYTGDGIMALFGAPIAHEDHARRACHAALELRDELRRFTEQLRVERGLDCAVRIGLHSGEVVVGKIGDDLRMDYTAQGATVNLAARMEQLAAPGQVYVSERTAHLARGFFRFRDLGPTRVKGVDVPVRVHELEGLGPLRSRFEVSRSRGLSALVGREEELALLDRALGRLLDGEGGTVAMVGEAGVGKSRLCHELTERCRRRGIRVTRATCPPHGRALPLVVALDLLRAYLGITAEESDETARDKVAGRISRLAPALGDEVPLLLQFLGIPDPTRPASAIAPEAVLPRLTDVVTTLERARGEREPMVLVVEDLHWIDPASESLLRTLVSQAASTRTLAVVNYRPEYAGLASVACPVSLAPLPAASADRLLAHLLGAGAARPELIALVRERAGGNPFFVEEIVQSLAEAGHLEGRPGAYTLVSPVDQIVIPETVRDLLAARIDRLGERDKAVLQCASVIGKTFPHDLLAEVVESSLGEVEQALERLEEADLVIAGDGTTEAGSSFKHPLTQEVASASLLGERRRRLHAAVAGALAAKHSERREEHAALVAYHWESAGELRLAAEWLQRAAAWIGARDLPEAMRHWRRVRELASGLEETAETLHLRRDACGAMLRVGLRIGMPVDERRILLEEIREAHRRLGDVDARTAATLIAMPAAIQVMEGEGEAPVRQLEEARAMAAAAGDGDLTIAVTALLAVAHLYAGRLSECLAATEPIATGPLPDPRTGSGIFTTNPYVLLLAMRASALRGLGGLQEGMATAERAAALARELDDPENLVIALSSVVDIALARGTPEATLDAAREALRAAERMGSLFALSQALCSLGLARAAAGGWSEAREVYERSLALLRQSHFGLPDEPFRIAVLAQALAHCGDLEGARRLVEEAAALAAARRVRLGIILAQRVRAEILMLERGSGWASEAAASLRAALDLCREIGARTYEALVRVDLALLAWHTEDLPGCKAHLHTALAQLREIGAIGQVGRIEEALSALQGGARPPSADEPR